MKNIFKNILLAATITGSMSCEKLVEGESISPNDPLSAPAELVIPSSELALGFVNEGEMARLAGMWTGYFTGADRQYISLGQYQATAADFDSPWTNIYVSVIKNALLSIEEAEAKQNPVQAAEAKAVLAQALGLAADLWGNVPAMEIGDLVNNPMPSYNSQAEVYAYVQQLLDEAATDIGTSPLLGMNQAAVYTLKARFYLHVKDYANAKKYAEMGISDSGSNVYLTHGDINYGNAGTYWMFLEWERSGYMTAETAFAPGFIEGRANTKTDYGHIWNYLYTTEGWYGAIEPNSHPSFWGGQGNGFFDRETDFPIVTNYENMLILAEASAREGDTGTALVALNAYRAYMATGGYIHSQYHTYLDDTGSEMPLKYDLLDVADFQSGGMLNADGLAEDRAMIREILAERYTAFVGLLEGFSDLRRTFKESDVRVPVPAVSGTEIPQRFVYPQAEINTNSNMPEVVDLFTPTPVNQ